MEKTIAVQPTITYPKSALLGRRYLVTADLKCPADQEWNYEEEEYVLYFMLHSSLFTVHPVGEPAVVLHRFGGTYGPAQFLFTANQCGTGVIQVSLVNQWGVPMRTMKLPVEVH